MEHQKILEKRTLIVVILTVITMILEIFYGVITHSMALLADGFHMGTHALALGITFLAYFLSRKFVDSDLFLNGTDKIKTLAAYTSSIFLGLTGIGIIIESLSKFINPVQINFSDAIIVAILGLIVNILSILIMKGKHVHLHIGKCKHEHHHHEEEVEEDNNFRSAYLHILADVLTSVLAIIALVLCKFMQVTYFDPCIGILGGIVIIKWSYGLLKDTIKVLLDMRCDI